uniref:Uncharacterized protein n=1 Tax=Anguilla anguilla TaxID=7936 RepID=A0A0E9UMS5_ANGAN
MLNPHSSLLYQLELYLPRNLARQYKLTAKPQPKMTAEVIIIDCYTVSIVFCPKQNT